VECLWRFVVSARTRQNEQNKYSKELSLLEQNDQMEEPCAPRIAMMTLQLITAA
jgi:hypothetical protein